MLGCPMAQTVRRLQTLLTSAAQNIRSLPSLRSMNGQRWTLVLTGEEAIGMEWLVVLQHLVLDQIQHLEHCGVSCILSHYRRPAKTAPN